MWVGKLLVYKTGDLVRGDSSNGVIGFVDADFYQQPETMLKAQFGLLQVLWISWWGNFHQAICYMSEEEIKQYMNTVIHYK